MILPFPFQLHAYLKRSGQRSIKIKSKMCLFVPSVFNTLGTSLSLSVYERTRHVARACRWHIWSVPRGKVKLFLKIYMYQDLLRDQFSLVWKPSNIFSNKKSATDVSRHDFFCEVDALSFTLFIFLVEFFYFLCWEWNGFWQSRKEQMSYGHPRLYHR